MAHLKETETYLTLFNVVLLRQVSFVIHNLPVIAKMAAVAKACGNMFQLLQGHAAETSGGLLICLPREQAAAYCKVRLSATRGLASLLRPRTFLIYKHISITLDL
jgi:hypothetical protein